MIYAKIDLYREYGVTKPEGADGTLVCMIHENYEEFFAKKTRPAMLVAPGGGYCFCSSREAEPIAAKYYAEGFDVFTIYYSLTTLSYPTQLAEGCMAVDYIRSHAKEFNIFPDKICGIGFSAGGHFIAALETINCDEQVQKFVGKKLDSALNAAILSYAVISVEPGVTHQGSADVVTGKNPDLIPYLSCENQVSKTTPPTFLWHTANDNAVPIANSLRFAAKCAEIGVPFELHVFEKGPHGLSLSNEEVCNERNSPSLNHTARWFELSLEFLKAHDFVISAN